MTDTATDPDPSCTADNSERRWRRPAVLTTGLALVVVALIAAGVVAGVPAQRSDPTRALDARRTAAITATRAEVVNLVSVSTATAKADIGRLLSGATASFREQFAQQATSFQDTLKQGGATSTGAVGAAGVVSLKGNKAVVLIAVTVTATPPP